MPRTFKTVDYEAILEQKVSLRECLPPDSSRLKAYRYRIYSSHKQKVLLAKSFDSCRWFSNYALNLTHDSYKATGRGLSRNEIINQLPELKKKKEWLTEVPSQTWQQVALDLSRAFLNFFEKRASFPRLKKKGQKQSIRFPQGIKLNGDYLTLPKLKKVYCRVSRLAQDQVKSVTVSMTASGKYFASCLYDDGQDFPKQNTEGKAMGIDLGLNHFCLTSNGSKHGNPNHYRKYEQKLATKQRYCF